MLNFFRAVDRLIVAVDVPTAHQAESIIRELAPYVGFFKVGLELTSAIGLTQAVHLVKSYGAKVFVDAKLHDIPNTIAGATRILAGLEVDMFTVHATSGLKGLRAAVENRGQAAVLGVTVLTSMDEAETAAVYGRPLVDQVTALVTVALEARVQALICSPHDLSIIKMDDRFDRLPKITPGVRPVWASKADQARVMTPKQAIMAGASALVVGRPIVRPPRDVPDRVEAVRRIIQEIEEGLINVS